VSQSKYLGTTVANQNFIQEEIKKKLNSGNTFYHSVHTFVFSSAVENLKNPNLQDYIFACGSV
jgi:HKD family nuclease